MTSPTTGSGPTIDDFARLLHEAAILAAALTELTHVANRCDQFEPGVTMTLMLGRAAAWVHSLARLCEPSDLQAHAAGCRALLEIRVDLALLTNAPLRVREVIAFEELARLEVALAMKNSDDTHPDFRPGIEAFVARTEEDTRALAKQMKVEERRNRWTNHHLGQDARRADAATAAMVNGPLLVQLNWGVHGSANPLFRQMPTEMVPGHAAMALEFAIDSAVACARFVSSFLGIAGCFDRSTLRIDGLRSQLASIADRAERS